VQPGPSLNLIRAKCARIFVKDDSVDLQRSLTIRVRVICADQFDWLGNRAINDVLNGRRYLKCRIVPDFKIRTEPQRF
jgi:hypothetical protein